MSIQTHLPTQLSLLFQTSKTPRHIYPAPPDEVRICEICGKPYACGLREWASRFRQRRTCGIACSSILRGAGRRYLLPRPCAYCREMFAPRNESDKFCSQSCYGLSKKGAPASYIPPKTPRIEFACPGCETIHLKLPSRVNGNIAFCSRECYLRFRQRGNLGGMASSRRKNAFYLSTTWERLRRAIKRRDDFTCQCCQRIFSPASGGMAVHHIRPRHLSEDATTTLHPVADAMTNLVLLCWSCHQKVHCGEFSQFLDLS